MDNLFIAENLAIKGNYKKGIIVNNAGSLLTKVKTKKSKKQSELKINQEDIIIKPELSNQNLVFSDKFNSQYAEHIQNNSDREDCIQRP